MEKIKRTKALKYILILLCIAYLANIFVGLVFYKPILNVWFSLFLGCVGSYMLAKGLFYRCDSSYLFGLICYSSFIAGVIDHVYNISFPLTMYFLLYLISFVILYIIFRQNIHLKSFAIICFQMILLFLKEMLIVNNFLFWILQGVYIFILIMKFIIYLLRTKERKNGV